MGFDSVKNKYSANSCDKVTEQNKKKYPHKAIVMPHFSSQVVIYDIFLILTAFLKHLAGSNKQIQKVQCIKVTIITVFFLLKVFKLNL